MWYRLCCAAGNQRPHADRIRDRDSIRLPTSAGSIGEIFHIFPSGTESMGDRGSKKAYTGPRTGIYLPTKFGCDRSIVVGCRSWNDRHTSRQTEWNGNKAHSLRTWRNRPTHGKATGLFQERLRSIIDRPSERRANTKYGLTIDNTVYAAVPI